MRRVNPTDSRAYSVEVKRWQSSIAQRMATLTTPWAMKDHLGISVVGFSRIVRLHDISTGDAPFAPKTIAVFEEELGQPIPFDDNGESEAHEVVAMDAGLNPELITFPKEVYSDRPTSVGFKFRIEKIGDVQSEKGDDSGVFDPWHACLLRSVENHLRKLIESELRKLGERVGISRAYRVRFSKDGKSVRKRMNRSAKTHVLRSSIRILWICPILSAKKTTGMRCFTGGSRSHRRKIFKYPYSASTPFGTLLPTIGLLSARTRSSSSVRAA